MRLQAKIELKTEATKELQAKAENKAAKRANPYFTDLGGYTTIAASSLTERRTRSIERRVDQQTYVFDHRGELDNTIATAKGRTDPPSRRLMAWRDMIEQAKHIEQPMVRAWAINGWVQSVIQYDHVKSESKVVQPTDYAQTAQQTLARGTGVCVDQAVLIAETLLRTGYQKDKIALFVISVDDNDGLPIGSHVSTALNVNNQIIILDPTFANTNYIPHQYYFSHQMLPNAHISPDVAFDLDGHTYGFYSQAYDEKNEATALSYTDTVTTSATDNDLTQKISQMGKDAGKLPKEPMGYNPSYKPLVDSPVSAK